MDYLSRRRKSSPVTSADNSPLVELASSKGKKREGRVRRKTEDSLTSRRKRVMEEEEEEEEEEGRR